MEPPGSKAEAAAGVKIQRHYRAYRQRFRLQQFEQMLKERMKGAMIVSDQRIKDAMIASDHFKQDFSVIDDRCKEIFNTFIRGGISVQSFQAD